VWVMERCLKLNPLNAEEAFVLVKAHRSTTWVPVGLEILNVWLGSGAGWEWVSWHAFTGAEDYLGRREQTWFWRPDGFWGGGGWCGEEKVLI
jgi:hypothetical protein